MRSPDDLDLWQDLSDVLLNKYYGEYKGPGHPIEVDVREDVHWASLGERLTHGIHPYPARLIRHIPILFLNSSRYTGLGDLVCDPFCGSGTVLLEALAAGRRYLGADSNPLARLISETKVDYIDPAVLEDAIRRAIAGSKRRRTKNFPNVVNRDYWFAKSVVSQLGRLRVEIDSEPEPRVRRFLLVCMSVAVRRASLADPRISVPVRLRKDQYPTDHPLHKRTNAAIENLRAFDVFTNFEAIATENVRRVRSLAEISSRATSQLAVSKDARNLESHPERRLRAGSLQLALTSPPYLGAQKYIRASSLSLGWLGFNEHTSLKEYEDLSIGREHFRKSSVACDKETGIAAADALIRRVRESNPLRAHIATTYLCEMSEAISELKRALKPGGSLIMVTGNNQLCGNPFPTTTYLNQMAQSIGFSIELELVDAIRSRGLMTRRNRSASVIANEVVTVLRKSL